ncbi:hypothetical protein AcV7_007879 [Taiwanofungus camphoratus]|nr:hypothetical protein AcV7_007879 [Antrodia cinnamomea]
MCRGSGYARASRAHNVPTVRNVLTARITSSADHKGPLSLPLPTIMVEQTASPSSYSINLSNAADPDLIGMSTPANSHIVDQAREHIDQAIAELQHNIHSLKARRNGLSPIFRLPVELLSEIFVLNANSHDLDGDVDLSWAKVAHVCNYWRGVALQTPRMWNRVTFTNRMWAAMQLERAKAIPLIARLDLRGARSDFETLVLLAQNIARVRELAVSAVGLHFPRQRVWSQFCLPAPQLESFLHTSPYHCEDAMNNLNHIPSDIFSRECPSLRRVELHQCTWCWKTSLFCQTVTHLVLDAHKVRMRTSLDEILFALERMPMLETLDLHQVAPYVPWDFRPEPGKWRTVHLAHLRSLHIDALALNCATLLNSITFPTDTALDLCCQPFRRLEEFYAVGVSISAKHRSPFSSSAALPFQSFTFSKPESPECLHLYAWTDELPIEQMHHTPPLESAALCLTLQWDGASFNNSVRSLMYACRALPLMWVRALCVPDYVSLTSRAWLEIFGAVRRLEALWVCGRSANHLPNALRTELQCECTLNREQAQLQGREQPHGHPRLLFPVLQRLILEDVDFTGDACPEACFFWQLQDFVMERRKRQCELQLCIYRCRNFILEQMYDLRLVGADVTWNGEELLDFDLKEIDSDDSEEDYEDFYDKRDPDSEQGEDIDSEEEGED